MTCAVGPTLLVSTACSSPDRLQDAAQLALHQVDLLIGQAQARQGGNVLDVLAADHGPMLAGDNAPHGRGDRHRLDPGPRRSDRGVPAAPGRRLPRGVPLLVLGGVETGLRPLAGTEQVLLRRWESRAARRPVVVIGRPLAGRCRPSVEHLLHPRVIADAVATALGWLAANGGPQPPFAIEAESGGGRISLWLTVDHPELVARLVLASVASETPAGLTDGRAHGPWIAHGRRRDDWGMFFGNMAVRHEAGVGRRGAVIRRRCAPPATARHPGALHRGAARHA